MKTDEYGIPEIRCRTAHGFLRQLDELHPRWRGTSWLFRGHNDATWRLLPKAMRNFFVQDYVAKYLGNITGRADSFDDAIESSAICRHRAENLHRNVVTETFLVNLFIEISDRVGLRVPYEQVDNLEMLDHLKLRADKDQSHNASPMNPNSVYFALAQHHGIPTRLLDFTFRPMAAAFFAAHCERKLETEPSHIAVWAINERRIYLTRLCIVAHRRSQAGFLYSQDGVFLHDDSANERYMSTGEWQPFEKELLKISTEGAVYKLTLPFSKKEELLYLLRRKRVTKSFLMPSFDNVAEDVKCNPEHWKKYPTGDL